MAFTLKYATKSSFSVPGSPTSVKKLATKLGQRSYEQTETQTDFPKLLVAIGSGVSMIKVNDFNSFERVGGTMIGGGTLLGLSNLLTGINDFDTIIEKAQQGDNAGVDMLVKDIYGDKSPYSDLVGEFLASSFAKVAADQPS
jgi:type II pantothenate kinase